MNEKPLPAPTPKRTHAHNLGHRLDALSIALKNLEEDPQTLDAARRLIASVRASSKLHGMTALADAAQTAENAQACDVPARLKELITLMRLEINRRGVEVQNVLLVSPDAALIATLRPALEAHARRVLTAATAQEALQLIAAQDVSFVVIDFVLTGQDGRALIATLRSRPATAALPIIAIAPKLADGVKDQDLVQEADGYFEKPIKAAEIADFLSFRLKRGHERGRESRRDSLTGLLNRAALCTSYGELMAQRSDPDEPVTLAMIGINRFDILSADCGPVVRDELVRQIASLLSSSFRTTDIVARWGISEFAVILPGEDHFGGTRAIEKVLSVLNRQKVNTPAGKVVPVTVCAGLTVVTGATTVDEAVERADHFLYAAYYMNLSSSTVYPIVSDTTHAVHRTERVALCLADPNMTQVLEQFLERDNFEPLACASVEAALSDLPKQRVHMVVLDDETPDDGAFRILQVLRAQPRYNRVPIVMLVSGEATIVRALELGANDYAIKPFKASAFIMRVRRILRHGAKSNEGKQPLVLIVDHEVPQLLVAGTALHQQGGCRILLAKGARDGLRRLTDALPDVLVLDMHMPDFSGNDFMKMIPLLPKLRKMEIIAAADTALTAAKLTSEVFQIRGRVTRPFMPGTFLEEIRQLIRLPPPESGSEPVDAEPIETEIQRILTLRT
jgi:diguanylate cyclase (GGDEF)-like protein